MNLNEMSLEQLYQLQIDAQQRINEVKREDKVLLWCLQLHTGYQHIFYDYDWGGALLLFIDEIRTHLPEQLMEAVGCKETAEYWANNKASHEVPALFPILVAKSTFEKHIEKDVVKLNATTPTPIAIVPKKNKESVVSRWNRLLAEELKQFAEEIE